MPLRFDPLVIEWEVKRRVRTREIEPFRPLGEEYALPLINDAVAWIRENGSVVIDMVRRMWAERRSHVGLAKKAAKRRVHLLRAAFVNEPSIKRIAMQLKMEAASPSAVEKQIISTTIGACTVALLFLVGMRASEFVRLDADCLALLGEDEVDQRTVLKGFAAKRNGMPRTWAASDDVVGVVRFLVELYAEIRTHHGQRALMLTSTVPHLLVPAPSRKAVRLGSSKLRSRMEAFANSPHRSIPSEIHLHPHMARKTYARFVVMRDKSALEALAYHYGHVHSSITDGAYVGTDLTLAALLQEEDRADLADALMDLLSSGALGGRAGKNLVKATEQMSSSATTFRGKRSLRATVEKLIDEGILLAPCDWGYCVYSKATSACGGDDKGPNTVRRAPDICATCSNFSVTERHRPYWNERLRRDEEFLKRSGVPEQARQVVAARAAHSRELLVALTPNIGARKHAKTK